MHGELEQVNHRLVNSEIDAFDASGSEITISALHKEVGDIVIRSENGQLVLEIGSHFHEHFGPAESQEAADRLVEFVTNFVNDRIILTIGYLAARPATARVEHTETGQLSTIAFATPKPSVLSRVLAPFRGRQETYRSFKWSGPLCGDDSAEIPEHDEASELATRLAGLNADDMRELAEYLAQQQRTGE